MTASKVILMARGLQRIVARNQGNPSIHEPVKNLVDSLMTEMLKRFSKVEYIEKLADATCLDPRFKKQAFVNSKVADEAVKRMTSAAAHVNSLSIGRKRRIHILLQLPVQGPCFGRTDERVASLRPSTTTPTVSTDAMMEMWAYLAEPLLPRTSDPLAWWRKCSPVYKSLMKTRLCIVATSVPSERVFSKTGQIISDRRNRLSPSKVRELVFLNANLP